MLKVQKPLARHPQRAKVFTLADVREAVAASTALSQTRIRDLVSAVTCFCSLIDREPQEVPLALGVIADRLNAINPVAVGISPKRLANIRSDLLAAIAASGLKAAKRPPKQLTEPWNTLRRRLKTKGHRIGLSRFCHYASAEGLAPTDVDDAVIATFMAVVLDHALHRKPNELHRQTAMIWNTVAIECPDLKLQPVTIPSFRAPPKRIAWALLPESFRDDAEAHLAWCTCTDPFAVDARDRPLATSSVTLRRAEIHAAVTALAESGIELATMTSLADLVTAQNFESIARRRLYMVEGKENAFNKLMIGALVQIAREWVKVDDAMLTELKRLATKVPGIGAGFTQKNKDFQRQFDDPAVLQRLRRLPHELWSKVRRDKAPNFRTLAHAQVALAVEILFYMAPRMRNLAALAFDEHLFLREEPGAVSSLEIPAGETKNKQPIAFDIPPHLARMLIAYRNEIAPKIMDRKPTCVFVNQDGTRKLPQTLSKLIQRTVFKETGITLTPHQFRHLAAKILLDHSPGAFELVRQLLGHQNLKTTTDFYAGVDTRRAARHHAELLQKWSEQQERALPRRTRRGRKPKTASNRRSKA